MRRLSTLFRFLTLINLFGCDGPPLAADALPYEGCRGIGIPCGDDVTTCTQTEYRSNGICTSVCQTDADCMPIDGYQPVCEPFREGGNLCVLPCDADADEETCPITTECTERPRLNGDDVALCMPS